MMLMMVLHHMIGTLHHFLRQIGVLEQRRRRRRCGAFVGQFEWFLVCCGGRRKGGLVGQLVVVVIIIVIIQYIIRAHVHEFRGRIEDASDDGSDQRTNTSAAAAVHPVRLAPGAFARPPTGRLLLLLAPLMMRRRQHGGRLAGRMGTRDARGLLGGVFLLHNRAQHVAEEEILRTNRRRVQIRRRGGQQTADQIRVANVVHAESCAGRGAAGRCAARRAAAAGVCNRRASVELVICGRLRSGALRRMVQLLLRRRMRRRLVVVMRLLLMMMVVMLLVVVQIAVMMMLLGWRRADSSCGTLADIVRHDVRWSLPMMEMILVSSEHIMRLYLAANLTMKTNPICILFRIALARRTQSGNSTTISAQRQLYAYFYILMLCAKVPPPNNHQHHCKNITPPPVVICHPLARVEFCVNWSIIFTYITRRALTPGCLGVGDCWWVWDLLSRQQTVSSSCCRYVHGRRRGMQIVDDIFRIPVRI